MVEKGRHINVDRDSRICIFCENTNSYVIEDGMHFLIMCTEYPQLRQMYFRTEWLNQITCDQLFINIMKDSRIDSVYALVKYLGCANIYEREH